MLSMLFWQCHMTKLVDVEMDSNLLSPFPKVSVHDAI